MRRFLIVLGVFILTEHALAAEDSVLGLPRLESVLVSHFMAPVVYEDADVPVEAGQIYYVISGLGGLRVVDNYGNVQLISSPGNAPTTAWAFYTPSTQGFDVASMRSCKWRRMGQNMEIDCLFFSGPSNPVGEPRLDLPSGYSVSSSLPNDPLADGVTYSVVGELYRSKSPVFNHLNTVLAQPGKTYLNFGVGTSSGHMMEISSAPVVNYGEGTHVLASVPIDGW